jgi:hypothetical protein
MWRAFALGARSAYQDALDACNRARATGRVPRELVERMFDAYRDMRRLERLASEEVVKHGRA